MFYKNIMKTVKEILYITYAFLIENMILLILNFGKLFFNNCIINDKIYFIYLS